MPEDHVRTTRSGERLSPPTPVKEQEELTSLAKQVDPLFAWHAADIVFGAVRFRHQMRQRKRTAQVEDARAQAEGDDSKPAEY